MSVNASCTILTDQCVDRGDRPFVWTAYNGPLHRSWDGPVYRQHSLYHWIDQCELVYR